MWCLLVTWVNGRIKRKKPHHGIKTNWSAKGCCADAPSSPVLYVNFVRPVGWLILESTHLSGNHNHKIHRVLTYFVESEADSYDCIEQSWISHTYICIYVYISVSDAWNIISGAIIFHPVSPKNLYPLHSWFQPKNGNQHWLADLLLLMKPMSEIWTRPQAMKILFAEIQNYWFICGSDWYVMVFHFIDFIRDLIEYVQFILIRGRLWGFAFLGNQWICGLTPRV